MKTKLRIKTEGHFSNGAALMSVEDNKGYFRRYIYRVPDGSFDDGVAIYKTKEEAERALNKTLG